ncbi:hypothetical protein GLOTRDRAFT_141471 [Gloeophyllum trabeum ATCC 11539]|uniref:F-box domain-containing protein n=1 Tax=Gloeophyllum trabeum (strain ATCC 11539 / FP-39264 / Madison 617) TaxID=670483 RepID=S7PSR9_GLOTA|nr:uncharacterized protein GLOTRDRAFT_141471 [Gloeophyllum trabeum ATCC 11539]EPQ50458.1 hypothetical protein GLOTRDRAFT_141471 [Gloeophyllum trabeum ATCC 11539]
MLILGHALSSCARCPPCKMNSIFHDNHRRVLRTIIPVSKDWLNPARTYSRRKTAAFALGVLACETHNSLELDHILGPAPCTTSLTRLVLKCAPGRPKTLPILDILATFSCLRDLCLVGFNGCGALRLPKLPSLRILRVWSCYVNEEQVSPTLGGLALETLEFFDTPTELIGMVCAYLHRGDSRVSPRKELDMGSVSLCFGSGRHYAEYHVRGVEAIAALEAPVLEWPGRWYEADSPDPAEEELAAETVELMGWLP